MTSQHSFKSKSEVTIPELRFRITLTPWIIDQPIDSSTVLNKLESQPRLSFFRVEKQKSDEKNTKPRNYGSIVTEIFPIGL